MARGVGSLTVSVNANTAKAIKNLKDFQSEARQTAKSSKDMAAAFQGNTLGDFQKRFGGDGAKNVGKQARDSAAGMNTLRSSVVDLTRDTNRYAEANIKQLGVAKQVNQAMQQLKAGVKAAAAGFIAFGAGLAVGQGLRGHLEYVHSLTDAWREFKSVFGAATSGYQAEMDKLAERQAKGDALSAKQDEQINARKSAAQAWRDAKTAERSAMMRAQDGDSLRADFFENVDKFGGGRDGWARAQDIRRDQVNRMNMESRMAEQKEAHQKRIEARNELIAKQEKARRDAEKQAADQQRKDLEAVAQLRRRIADFGKTDAHRERDEYLRKIKDPKQRAEARGMFNQLQGLEEAQSLRESLRTKFTSWQDPLSREGAAQRVRSLAQNPTQKIQEKQLAKQDRMERHLARIAQNPIVLRAANI